MDFGTVAGLYERYKHTSVCTVVHPNDVMFNTGRTFYFTVGESALKVILQGLSLSWNSDVSRILDLPCGHGRVARHLRAAFPDAEVLFCDIDKDGVDFCASQFRGLGIYSQPDLTKVRLPNDNDIIWVGSLFTHIDRTRTAAWLAHLCHHLANNGILVATFHGYFTAAHRLPGGGADKAEALQEMNATGYGYSRYKTLGTEAYGFSLAKPSVVVELANIPGTRILAYIERGWANNHDVLILTKNDRLKPFSYQNATK